MSVETNYFELSGSKQYQKIIDSKTINFRHPVSVPDKLKNQIVVGSESRPCILFKTKNPPI